MRPSRLAAIAALVALPGVAVAGSATPKAVESDHAIKGSSSVAPPAAVSYNAEILVLHANNGHRGIDRSIGDIPALKQSPFASYKSYALVERVTFPLKAGDSQTVELPDGRALRAELHAAPPKKPARFSASINQPGTKTFLSLLEVAADARQQFIVPGESDKRGGILVFVIRVGI